MLRIAALLHDLGKIIVPAEILSKPGKLNDTEFLLIHQHAAAGAEILADIDFGGDVAAMVRQHHERLDGSGYPAGLKEATSCPKRAFLPWPTSSRRWSATGPTGRRCRSKTP